VAEGHGDKDERRSGARAARTSAREDFFVRALGDEWVEVEPGIYQHVPRPVDAPSPESAEPELDDALIDRLSSPLDEEGADDDASVSQRAGLLRSWMGRRSEDG
jgi:hypothetical protein